jgi:hypothetical protein
MENKKLLLLPVLIMIFSFAFVSATINDYIIHYKFDETSGTFVNDEVDNYDANSSGFYYDSGNRIGDDIPSVEFVDGVKGGAYDFGTYSTYTLGTPTYSDISLVKSSFPYQDCLSDASIFVWIKPKNIGGAIGQGGIDIIAGNGFEYSGWGWAVDNSGYLTSWLAGMGGYASTNTILQDNNWYYVGYVTNGSTLKYYINGVEEASFDNYLGFICDYENLTIGFYEHSQPSQPYYVLSNMTFDEFKYFERTLSPDEALALYNSYNTPTAPTSGGILHFDNLIEDIENTKPEPEPTITGEVTTDVKPTFSISTFFNNIVNWFKNLFK